MVTYLYTGLLIYLKRLFELFVSMVIDLFPFDSGAFPSLKPWKSSMCVCLVGGCWEERENKK